MDDYLATDSLDIKVKAGLAKLFPDSFIVECKRQARWRPSWDVTIKIKGILTSINVRAEKGQNYVGPLSLEQEAKIHDVLERHGIPVPHVYGMLDDPVAIVMDVIPGKINLATADSDVARQAVRKQYVSVLADIHRIPIEAFASIGLQPPASPQKVALNLYQQCEKIYRQRMSDRHFPLMEFIWRWVKNNAPKHRQRSAFVTADSGQFLFDGDKLTGLIDFEVGYIGDPLAEFSGMRLRDSTEPLGDINTLIDQYEALTGDTIDHHSVEYHTAGFCAVNGFLLWPLAFSPGVDDDYVAYLSFSVGTSRWAITAIAEVMGVELGGVALPEPLPLTFTAAGNHLVAAIDSMPAGDENQHYEQSKTLSLARFMERSNRYGRSIMMATLEDISKIVGRPFDSLEQAEIALTDFIKTASDQQDRQLVRYFHRWLQRQNFILQGCGQSAYLTNMDLQVINPRN
ncbi:MAG: phosphotransferase [Spongiibacteraceae bacterium]